MANKIEDYCERFESPAAFVEAITKRQVNKVFVGKECASHKETARYNDFSSTKNFDEALDLFVHGDRSKLSRIEAALIRKKIKPDFAPRRALKHDVRGCIACVPAFNAGIPTNMLRVHKTPVKTNVINIVFGTGTSCRYSAERIEEAGARLLSVISTIERRGVRVNLYCGTFAESKGQKLANLIRIKRATDPLNRLMIAFPVANPSFHRRLAFAFRETCPAKLSSTWPNGYGYTINATECKELLDETFKGASYHAIDMETLIDTKMTPAQIADKYFI